MRPISVSVGPLGTAGNIAAAQAATRGVNLTLNGSLVNAAGVAVISPPAQIQISDLTTTDLGQVYIQGTDPSGTPHAETVTIPNTATAGLAVTTAKFATINIITPLFTTAGTLTVSTLTTAPAPSSMIRLDEWADAPIGVQVSVNGVVSYTVQHSFDDPNDLVNPVPQAAMFWDTGLVPAGAVGAAAGITFAIATAPLWLRLLLNSGTGSAKMVVTQYNVVEP